jgi:hypothetical protein
MGEMTADEATARLAGPIELRKLAGVLGETEGLGTDDPRVVVGIGINADWAAADFPPEIAASMTSLREASAGRPIDLDGLLESFEGHLEARVDALRAGFFDLATWAARQATTGRLVSLDAGAGGNAANDGGEAPVGGEASVRALGVDSVSGGLVVEDPGAPSGERIVHAGEVVRVRLAAKRV